MTASGAVLASGGVPGAPEMSEAEIRAVAEVAHRHGLRLAAHAHGVGSSIGWIVGPGRDAARELLGIPRHKVVRTAISLGYPAEGDRRPRSGRGQARKPLGEFVHLERYG